MGGSRSDADATPQEVTARPMPSAAQVTVPKAGWMEGDVAEASLKVVVVE